VIYPDPPPGLYQPNPYAQVVGSIIPGQGDLAGSLRLALALGLPATIIGYLLNGSTGALWIGGTGAAAGFALGQSLKSESGAGFL
jgi:hypothetical protein